MNPEVQLVNSDESKNGKPESSLMHFQIHSMSFKIEEPLLRYYESNPQFLVLVDELKLKFKPLSNEKIVLIHWIVAGFIHDGSERYRDYMGDILFEVKRRSDNIYRLLMSREFRKVIFQDYFIDEMVINLIAHLEIDESQKENLFELEIVKPLSFNFDGTITIETANQTTAMILYVKTVRIKRNQDAILKKGLAVNSTQMGRTEFLKRVKVLFPDNSLEKL